MIASFVRYATMGCSSPGMGVDMVRYTDAGTHHLHTVPDCGDVYEAQATQKVFNPLWGIIL